MHIRRIIFLFFIAITMSAVAQQGPIDTLKQNLRKNSNDTTSLILLGKIADLYSEINPDSAYRFANEMLSVAKKLNMPLEEVGALDQMGYALLNMGNYPRSLQTLLSAIKLSEDPESEKNLLAESYNVPDEFTDRLTTPRMQRLTKLARTLQFTGILYGNAGSYERAKYYYLSAISAAAEANNLRVESITFATLGRTYLSLKNADSALICLDLANKLASMAGFNRYIGSILLNTGRVYMAKGRTAEARAYFLRAIEESRKHGYFRGIVASNLALSDMYKNSAHPDSILFYINDGLPVANYLNAPDLLLRSYKGLADYYKKSGNNDSTVKYQSLIISINDSLFNSKQAQQFQNIDFDEKQRQQQIEAAKTAYRNRLGTYALLSGVFILSLVGIIFWRSSQHRAKANSLLSKQKSELEEALNSLKNTQKQLVQSEKMASLGELTAGIAHEIQNPLNFVNNFSEVSKELLAEMKEELNSGNSKLVIEIAGELHNNLEKILHHGKRADAIVKGMLQHSRAGSGKKEPVNINTLAEEYLRLSFHGLRAKDKNFSVSLNTAFDETIGNIEVIPQDIGRAMLNLYNNAFYAVAEKAKQEIPGYEPTVSVATKRENGTVKISVIDNGQGISQTIIDKIFQPFYTTKPTGVGTGLGLSLAYDIVTKGHGGELKVDTKESEGTSFIIKLPVHS